MKADMIELIFLAAIVVVCKIFEHTKTGKKWKEKQKQREDAEREAAEWDEAEWQKGLDDRVRAAEETKKLSFEIPTMRPSAPDAETKLPQADRIFVRHEEEPIEEEDEDDTGRWHPDVLVDYAPTAIKKPDPPKMTVPTKTKPVNSKYQEWLKRQPTERGSDNSIALQDISNEQSKVRLLTNRDRLIEGIILAEILGKPKAYQKREYR